MTTTRKPRAKRPHSHPKNSAMANAYNAHHRLYPIAEKSALGRALLETVVYFLRPHIVSAEAHRENQRAAAKSAGRALDIAHAQL